MTIDDMDAGESPLSNGVKRVAVATALVMALGGAAGMTAVGFKTGWTATLIIVAGAAMAIAGMCAWLFLRLQKRADAGEIAPKERRARMMMVGSMVLGGVLGLLLAVGTIQIEDPMALYGNKPIEGWIAGLAVLLWFTLLPALTLVWWRNIDEHE